MLSKVKMRALIELISELVDEHEPWSEKKEGLMVLCSPDELISISEFAAWFDSPEEVTA